LFKDKDQDLSSKYKDCIVKDKDQDKDFILVLKESLRTRTNITGDCYCCQFIVHCILVQCLFEGSDLLTYNIVHTGP